MTGLTHHWIHRLGYAGLIPFALLTLVIWLWPELDWPGEVLLAYGALIFCFVGAIHFGFGIADERMTPGGIIWSIMPVAMATPMLLAPPALGLPLVAAGLVLAWTLDQTLFETILPPWYRNLRDRLTAGAVMALMIGWLGVM